MFAVLVLYVLGLSGVAVSLWTIIEFFRDPKGLRRFHCFHPLAGLANAPYMWLSSCGQRYLRIHEAHQKHSILRLGPNHISFGDCRAIKDVYGHGTKVGKDDFYRVLSGSHRHVADVQDRAEHTRKRKVLASAYAQKSIVHWDHIVADKVGIVAKQFDKAALAGETVDYRLWSNLLTVEIINAIGLSSDLGIHEKGEDAVTGGKLDSTRYTTHYIEALHGGVINQAIWVWATQWYQSTRKLSGWHKNYQLQKQYDGIVLHQVRTRLARKQQGEKLDDFFSSLLYDKDGAPNNLPLGELVAECSIMMNAGSDTTAIAMANVLYMLCKHPECLVKLREEIDCALDAEDTVAPYDKVKHLPYPRACLDESLRMFPPTALGLPRVTP